MDKEKNIFFFLDEEKSENKNYDDIQNFIEDFNFKETTKENKTLESNHIQYNYQNAIYNDELIYFKLREKYFGDDYSYYNDNYNLKQLLKICDYYEATKTLKMLKLTKKNNIIEFIVNYENSPENIYMVYTRHKLWAYMEELINNPFMKKHILWK